MAVSMQFLYRFLSHVRPAFIVPYLKKLLRVKRFVLEIDKGRFFIDPFSLFGNKLLSDKKYEPEMEKTLKNLLKPGDTFVDLGANELYFSILGSKLVGPTGKVISIEPQRRLQGVLVRNIAENSAFNINIIQRAISDSIGVSKLYLAPDTMTGSSGLFRSTKYKLPTELVLQTTLSKLFELLHIGSAKLVKIDVEGFEYEAILGSKELFSRNVIENIALELHPSRLKKRGKSENEILDFLYTNGYKRNDNYENLVLTKSFT